MIRRSFVIAAGLLGVLALLGGLPSQPARANQIVMCQGDVSGASTGSRVIVNTSSTTSPQPSYVLNSSGCATIAQADVGFFASLGFQQPGPISSIVFTTGVLTGTTAVQITPSLPIGAYIRDIFVDNSTANAVTGGVNIGTTSGAADVVSALTCAANCLTFVADSAVLKRVFSKTAQQALFAVAQTAGNSANLNITVTYGFF